MQWCLRLALLACVCVLARASGEGGSSGGSSDSGSSESGSQESPSQESPSQESGSPESPSQESGSAESGECGGCDPDVLIQQSFTSLTVVQQNFLVQTGISSGICSNIVELQMLTIVQQEVLITTALTEGVISSVEVLVQTEVQMMINLAVGLGMPVVGFNPVSCSCQASSLMQSSFLQLTIIEQTWLVQQGIINGITWSGIPSLIALTLVEQSTLIREALIQSIISSIESLSAEEKEALKQLAASLGFQVELNAADSEIIFVFEDGGGPPVPPGRITITPGGFTCFSGDSIVTTEEGPIKIKDLKNNPDANLKVMGSDGTAAFQPVQVWLHNDPSTTLKRRLQTASGDSITLSHSHMVYVVDCRGGDKVAKFAGKVNKGECLLVNRGDRFETEKVTNMSSILTEGAYQFTTESGNVVVDDVVASCYSVGEYETIQHLFYSFLYSVQKWLPSFIFGADPSGQHPSTKAMVAFHTAL